MNKFRLNQIAKNVSRKFEPNINEVVFINTGDVLENNFLHNNLSNRQELPGQAKKAIKKGDILYSEIRPGNGRYLYVKNDLDNYIVSTKFMVIEANHKYVIPEFLFLLLTSTEVTEYFKVIAETRSGTFPQITFDSISGYEVNLPSKEEQKDIVNIIGSIDDKIQLNTQTNQTLEQIAQAIYKSWFVDYEPTRAKATVLAAGGNEEEAETAAMTAISGKTATELTALAQNHPARYQQLATLAQAFLAALVPADDFGEIPEGWEVKKVGEIAKITKGKKPKNIYPSQESNLLPHILVAALEGKYTEFCETTKMTVSKITDTLILMDGSASGKIAIGHHGVVGSTLAKMELFDNKYWAVLYHFLKSKEKDIQDNTTGTSIPHADKARINDYSLSICDGCILDFYNQFFKKSLLQSIENRKRSYLLDSIRDTLLPKLLSGELQDA